MSALDVIRRVETLGGHLLVEGNELKLRATVPLPEDLVSAVSNEKLAIMVALGAPMNVAVASVLAEIRPHLPRSLRSLPDDRLLTLVNWSLLAAFDGAIRKVSA